MDDNHVRNLTLRLMQRDWELRHADAPDNMQRVSAAQLQWREWAGTSRLNSATAVQTLYTGRK